MKSNFFYAKLAKSNIERNRRNYIPFWLSCVVVIASFFNLANIKTIIANADRVYGNSTVAGFLTFGTYIVGFLALIFIFYANSFLMKNRKKEIGLYGILGLEKRHVAVMLFFETLAVAGTSMIAGLLSGIVFGRLLFLAMSRIIRYEVNMNYHIDGSAIGFTVVFFLVLFLCVLVFNLVSMHLIEPIELLKSKNVGEKKVRFLKIKALLGVVFLGVAYYIAIMTTNPLQAIFLFFIAVCLVITATHYLFLAGSVVLLHFLKKRKGFYYKPTNFISTSSLIYRMKKNAAGLANICILSCMVIVTVGGTAAVYDTMEKIIDRENESEYNAFRFYEEGKAEKIREKVHQIAEKSGVTVVNEKWHLSRETMTIEEENGLVFTDGNEFNVFDQKSLELFTWLTVISQEDYEELVGAPLGVTLEQGEIGISFHPTYVNSTEVQIGQTVYPIKTKIDDAEKNKITNPRITGGLKQMIVVVANEQAVLHFSTDKEEKSHQVNQSYHFDVTGDKQAIQMFNQKILERRSVNKAEDYLYIKIKKVVKAEMYSLNGGLYFIGIFLGSLFLLLTVLIIYFKQISEGEEDRERFTILKKVGLSSKEAKQVISKQLLMIFFLPLVMAIIHVSVASIIIARITTIGFGIMFADLMPYMIATMVAFTVIYFVVFLWTSRTYYQIVHNGNAR